MKEPVRKSLLEKLPRLEGLTDTERNALYEALHKRIKYGIVWEYQTELVEERMKEELPVLHELSERAILPKPDDSESIPWEGENEAPNHVLIEGDNLPALTALTYTHAGRVDVIYIDPPYNTGKKDDFIYNDKMVGPDDAFRHSKWLSFMARRLRIAKQLLSERGVIFISIDDNEQANLKLLCDSIFGSENMIAVCPTIMNLKGNQDEYGFAGTHEYTIVYVKNKIYSSFGQLDIEEESIQDWSNDAIGYYKKGATLKRTGIDAPREKRPYGYFPILVNKSDKGIASIERNEYALIYDAESKTFNDEFVESLCAKYEKLGYKVLLPEIDNNKTSWRWGYEKVKAEAHEIIVVGEKNGYSLYKKQRPMLGDLPTTKPKSVLYKAQYSSGNGTAQLKDLSLEKHFKNPKPIDLLIDLLKISTVKTSCILDFFAGSGTTLHATMQLNAEDGGHRQCILVTNNENGICENVTYERCRRVIEGYTTPNGKQVQGLRRNRLRYFQVGFVQREPTLRNRRALMEASTDMLCIKEGLYAERDRFGCLRLRRDRMRYFAADDGRAMLVVYREEEALRIVEEIRDSDLHWPVPLKIYIFSPNDYAFDDDFEEVTDRVELCALPEAILNAYRYVLPRRRERTLAELDAEAKNDTTDTENTDDTL